MALYNQAQDKFLRSERQLEVTKDSWDKQAAESNAMIEELKRGIHLAGEPELLRRQQQQ